MQSVELQTIIDKTIVDFCKDAKITPALLAERRQRIVELEEAVKNIPQSLTGEEFNEGKLKHHFADGVYARELFIPKGSLIIGKIHKSESFNVVSKGSIAVICPNLGFNIYEAPHSFVSKPFTKRVGIALEDTIWTTILKTNHTDVKLIEEEFILNEFIQGELK